MDLLDSVTEEIFSRMPLVIRNFRRKLMNKGTAEGLETGVTPVHIQIMKTLHKGGEQNVTGVGPSY